jgi:hypothetical protein
VTSASLAPFCAELSFSKSCIPSPFSRTRYRVSILYIELCVFGNSNRQMLSAVSICLLLYRTHHFLVKNTDYDADRWAG